MRAKIKSALQGKSESDQSRIITEFLDDWPSRNLRGEYVEIRRQLQRRLQRLEQSREVRAASVRTVDDPFVIAKQGHLTVALIGLPNAGKSLLYQRLGGKGATVADYPFATTSPVASLVALDNLRVQLIDLPPIVEGTLEAVPYGKKMSNLLGSADVVCVVLELSDDVDRQKARVHEELRSLGIDEASKPVRYFRTRGEAEDDWRDVLPAIARAGGYQAVFTKPPGQSPEDADRLWVATGANVRDAAQTVHRDLARRLSGARVWGQSVEHSGQMVSADHVLFDNDMAELRAG